jgi:peptide/nickel transport system substrate-binding protein
MRCTKSLSLAAISVSVFVLFGQSRCLATQHPRYGGTLRVELNVTAISLDPREWKTGSFATAENEKLAALVYDRLLTLDDYGRFQPVLATEWSHDAAFKNWQFKLRAGVRFSDGTALSPRDVAMALQPLLPAGLQISPTESGIQIHANRSTPDLLEQLASGRYFTFRAQPDGALLGTGPFVLAESTPATPSGANLSALRPARMKFRANDDAWSGRPFVDAVEVTLGDPALREILDLQVGRVELIDIPPDLVRKARQENLRVWSSPPRALLALRFDDAQPATSDPRFREALDSALDRDTMANVLLQRQALPSSTLLPQWLSGYAFLFGTTMSLDRARQLRSSLPANLAGGSDPVRLRVDAFGDLMKLLGERVVVNARQANISIQVVPHSAPSSGSSATTSPGIGLHLFAWHYDSLSPRAELQALAQHLHVEAGAELPADSSDPEKLYTQERGLLDARPLLPLVLLPEFVGIAPTVRNWTVAPSGEWRLADVWIDSGEPPASNSEETSGWNAASGVHP